MLCPPWVGSARWRMIERFKWPLLLRVLGLPHQGAELPGVAVLRVRKIPFRVFPSTA